MKRDLPPYCYARQKGRYVYYERTGKQAQRIYAKPGTPEFAIEYAKLLNGVEPMPTNRNFRALVKSYHASKRYKELAPRTQKDYAVVTDWLIEKMGDLPVSGMQTHHIIRAQEANAETRRFANYIVQVLRVLLKHAVHIGWRKDNPAIGIPLFKSQGPERQPWPDAMVTAYRAKATGRARLVFELCLGTGQRIGDVLKMRWSDIERDGIHVRQNKTKAALWVPFTAHLKAVLAETPMVGLTICAWGKNGRPTSYRGAADLIYAVRVQIGAEAYDIHSLRYTAASELAALGCSDDLIKAVTGHTSAGMVARYAGKARQISRATEAQEKRK